MLEVTGHLDNKLKNSEVWSDRSRTTYVAMKPKIKIRIKLVESIECSILSEHRISLITVRKVKILYDKFDENSKPINKDIRQRLHVNAKYQIRSNWFLTIVTILKSLKS